MSEIHDPKSCNRWCKVHWYFDSNLKFHKRYPMVSYYQVGTPINGKKQWSGGVLVYCGPPGYYPKAPKDSEEQVKEMASTGISTQLFTYLKEHLDELVTINQLEEKFLEYDRRRIMSNMSNLMNTKAGRNIERVQTGIYRYNSEPKIAETPKKEETKSPELMLFEKVRDLKEGCVLLSDDEGNLWTAKELKF